MLFVEGANDPFCRLDLLEEVLAQVATPSGKAASPRKSGRKRYKSSAAGARTNPAAKPGVSRRQKSCAPYDANQPDRTLRIATVIGAASLARRSITISSASLGSELPTRPASRPPKPRHAARVPVSHRLLNVYA